MQTDSQVTLTLVEESLELISYANAANRNALRTPRIAPFRRENFGSSQDIVEVIHRFALSHKDDIGKPFRFRERVYLIEDIGCGERTLKSLLASLAEQAIHLTAHLA